MSHSHSSHFFKDLGKATFRGIKKCPNCNTINGLRVTVCKNKECNHNFQPYCQKLSKSKLKSGFDCYRLRTEHSSSFIYSIRAREKGPNYRGFVEVPIIRGLAKTSDPSLDPEFIKETTARCHLDSCKKVNHPIETSINTSHLSFSNAKSQTSSLETNITLTIIQACDHIKSAVKCTREATPLPISSSFIDLLSIPEETKQEMKVIVNSIYSNCLVHQLTKNNFVVKCKMSSKQLLGYLHCSFSNLEKREKFQFCCTCSTFKAFQSKMKQGNFTLNDSSKNACAHFYLCLISIITNSCLLKDYLFLIEKIWPNEINSILNLNPNSSSISNVDFCFNQQDDNITHKLLLKNIIDVKDVEINFKDWLSSVIEMINQSMHYSFNGKPDPLIFYCPHQFFYCFLIKIAQVLNIKRVPSLTTIFTRKNSPPIGIFTKYTYQFTDIEQIKTIFSTSKIKLETTRNFVQKIDGSFDYINPDSVSIESEIFNQNLNKSQFHLIKPCEFKTFLKIGYSNSERKEMIPFLIEWIPDLLPKSKVGEIQFHYQFGHLKNGQIDSNY